MSLLETVRSWGRMVRFSHSLFALPFALSGATLAAADSGIQGRQLLWIVVAMFGARNAAMGFNRLADQGLDARNPRTRDRELPRGRLGRGSVWIFTLALAALFVFAAFRLGRLCGLLSPVALAVVLGYSYSKRFTWASHLWLGLGLALAPLGAWLAVGGTLPAAAWLLGTAVLAWVAGFDVVYACQDVDFDRREGLWSIPARFGRRRALQVARLLHLGALLALGAVGIVERLHPIYWVGWCGIAGLLLWEHAQVREDDFSRVDAAFLNASGLVSVSYFVVVLVAVLAPRLW